MEKHILALETAGYSGELSLEDQALELAIEETYEETGRKWKPWAKNARSLRVGDLILIVDSDTIVPEVSKVPRCLSWTINSCLPFPILITYFQPRPLLNFIDIALGYRRTASGTLRANWRSAPRSPSSSMNRVSGLPNCVCSEPFSLIPGADVMQVAHHFFENGISHFTRRINKCISLACANGEVAPFVGHNAFLRWSAIQDAAFVDPADQVKKIWSESNVSEDFDMALRLQLKGYIIRWANYSEGGFKEGVSLTVDDELNRWQKYSYGAHFQNYPPVYR
jgi:hypothetical protein